MTSWWRQAKELEHLRDDLAHAEALVETLTTERDALADELENLRRSEKSS